tara:strand:+ start:55 stop:312 length:258 start_codon:yes stop_codon:yes gene_type:complete
MKYHTLKNTNKNKETNELLKAIDKGNKIIKIYRYKNYDFQINLNLQNKYEVCDLNSQNIFGSAFFKSIEDAIKELEIYIDIINID